MDFSERHKTVTEQVNYLFTKRAPLVTLWQEIAENFYPELANFTYQRSLGDSFADYLSTSVPVIVRRDLGNSISSYLRPEGQMWAHITTDRPDSDMDSASQAWLQQKSRVMYRAMTDPIAQMTKATKAVDHDFVTFGNGVLSVEVNRTATALLYRSWHLRDVVWCERYDGTIGTIGRKWKPTARDLINIFGKDRVHQKVLQSVETNGGKNAYKEFNVMHIVVPTEDYDYDKQVVFNMPYVSIYVDMDNKWVMEEIGLPTQHYVIPRWEVIPGVQYGYSPATVAGLPDARLIQQITFTLLKAGEKAADPPMIGVEEAIKSPVDIRPGMITWVANDYDEKTGEALRTLPIDSRGIPVGFNMQESVHQNLISSFYLNKLSLPQFGPEMTAYEVSQRLQEYIRQALPLFGPIEDEYNAKLCEQTFQLLLVNNAFGSPQEIPPALQGRDIRFRFESPLIAAEDQKLVQAYTDAINLATMSEGLDPSAPRLLKVQPALRDALRGREVPASWVEDEDAMAQISAEQAKQQKAMQMAAMVQQGAEAANTVGQAGQSLNGAVNGRQ